MPTPSPLDTPRVRYLCQRCGNCCRWPGDVHVSDDEIHAIAEYLGIPEKEFIDSFCRLNASRTGLSLIEKPNGECVFLEGANTCVIQAVKPGQCRAFPNGWNFPGWREKCEAVEATDHVPQ